jgi:uncharacterized membrane protein
MQHELLSVSPDIIFISISNLLTAHDFSVTYFLAFYFIFWGSIDIVLFYQLFKKNLRAFPVSLFLIGTFVIYSLFRFSYTHSLVLLGVIFMDLCIMLLIYREYKKVKRETAKVTTTPIA